MRIVPLGNRLNMFKKIATSIFTKYMTPVTLIALLTVIVVVWVIVRVTAKNKEQTNQTALLKKEMVSPKIADSVNLTKTTDALSITPPKDLNSQNWVSKKALKNVRKKENRLENGSKKVFSAQIDVQKEATKEAQNEPAKAADLSVKSTLFPALSVTDNDKITTIAPFVSRQIQSDSTHLTDNTVAPKDVKNGIYRISKDYKVLIQTSDEEAIKIVAPRGTIMVLPPKAFNLPDKSPVELTIKEQYKVSDAILGNLNTEVESGGMLVSGGMIFVEATYKNKAIEPDKEVQILMPKTYEPSESVPETEGEIEAKAMRVFVAAKVNPIDKTFKWQLKGGQNSNFMLYRRSPSATDKLAELKKIYAHINDLCGCDRMFTWKMYYNYHYEKLPNSNKKIRVKDSTFINSDRRPSGFMYEGINHKAKLSPFCKELAMGADSTRRTLGLSWQKRHKALENTPYEGMDMYSKYYVKPNFKEMSWRERRDFIPYDKLRTDIREKIIALKYIEKRTITEDKEYERRLAAYKKLQKDLFSPTDKTKTLQDLDGLSYYIFSTNQLGYINCDYFRNTPPESLATCTTNVQIGEASVAKLIFKKERMILDAKSNGGFLSFVNIPKNQEAIIVVMKQKKVKNGTTESMVSYLAMKEINTSTLNVSLQFEELTPDALKAKLGLLDNNQEAVAEQKVIQ